MADLPRVLAVFTGGTISMRMVPGRGVVPARSGGEILSLVPRIAEIADVRIEDFDRIPGPHWTPERMLALAHHLDERLAGGGFVGAVVTHGTDTLEETAFLLDLVLRTDLPVVLTGAMKTADDPSWDGPGNLLASVRCAISPLAGSRGVLVVLEDTVHAASAVTKMHTEAFGAFGSPRHGPLGAIDLEGPRFTSGHDGGHDEGHDGRERIGTTAVEPRVALIAAAAGIDGSLLRHALQDGVRGIVLEALGRGNVPPGMLPAVREAVGSGVPVVVASRCPCGRTGPEYGYEGGGLTLREAGAVFAGDLSAVKARIKLMVLLGAGHGSREIAESFAS